MLQLTIGVVVFIALNIYVKVEETEQSKKQKEYDETDWNEFYAKH